MKRTHLFLALTLSASALLFAGCTHRVVAGTPPPPGMAQDRIAHIASENGMHDGRDAGRFDAEHGAPYAPKHNPNFRNFPGWAPPMGARGFYRDFYQNAFLRGYDLAYRRHD